jgi:hypothetical protein
MEVSRALGLGFGQLAEAAADERFRELGVLDIDLALRGARVRLLALRVVARLGAARW